MKKKELSVEKISPDNIELKDLLKEPTPKKETSDIQLKPSLPPKFDQVDSKKGPDDPIKLNITENALDIKKEGRFKSILSKLKLDKLNKLKPKFIQRNKEKSPFKITNKEKNNPL